MPEEKTESEKKGKKKSSQKIILIAVVIIALAGLSFLAYDTYVVKPSESLSYHYATAFNQTWAFRADLRDAEKVKVTPTDDTIYFELFNIGETPIVKNITIAFKDAGSNENPYYQLQIIELVTKLKKIYESAYQNADPPTFNAVEVGSYYKLPGKIQNPIIAIVHPKFATETSINLENHVITLNAKTHEDMDLVTTKLLMIALQLKRTD